MTEKKEQTIGGSNISLRGGELITTEEKEIIMPPEKAKKLTIATVAKLEELKKAGYLEINVDTYDVFKESEKVVKRLVNGKEIKVGPVPRKKKETEKAEMDI